MPKPGQRMPVREEDHGSASCLHFVNQQVRFLASKRAEIVTFNVERHRITASRITKHRTLFPPATLREFGQPAERPPVTGVPGNGDVVACKQQCKGEPRCPFRPRGGAPCSSRQEGP